MTEADHEAREQRHERQTRAPRLQSLDALRGLTIVLMLLVNNIALDQFTPRHLQHAPWASGVTLADFVFPWFLFCVGAAIPFSASSFRKTGLPMWRYDIKAVRRAGLLVVLGCLVVSSVAGKLVFALGVLQIIGLAYLVGALLYQLPLHRRLIVSALFLLGYWAAIKFIPVPGSGAGVFEENRNILFYINKTYLKPLGLAGLSSLIPTSALVIIGSAIGDLFHNKEMNAPRRLVWLAITGVALILGGIVWNTSLIYNKTFWTPSYILLTAGPGILVLGLLYLIIDIRGWRMWSFPLLVFGSNAILAYVAPILVKVLILQKVRVNYAGRSEPISQWLVDFFVAHTGRIAGGWLYTATYIAVWWLILLVLYRKKWFLRV
ncbi:MAG: DUF5009 domain-containing protein [Armatimonadetes bacterium]|nr:DUF5009 domain-containing protein [Armatimonadota bacterium]